MLDHVCNVEWLTSPRNMGSHPLPPLAQHHCTFPHCGGNTGAGRGVLAGPSLPPGPDVCEAQNPTTAQRRTHTEKLSESLPLSFPNIKGSCHTTELEVILVSFNSFFIHQFQFSNCSNNTSDEASIAFVALPYSGQWQGGVPINHQKTSKNVLNPTKFTSSPKKSAGKVPWCWNLTGAWRVIWGYLGIWVSGGNPGLV